MVVTADTIRLVSQGEYTVGVGKTITESDFAIYLQWATDQFALDNPGNATASLTDQAISLLVCHYIDRANNDQHLKYENAGDGKVAFDSSGSNWMKSYQVIVTSLVEKIERDRDTPVTVKLPRRGVVRKDATVAAKGMFTSDLSY